MHYSFYNINFAILKFFIPFWFDIILALHHTYINSQISQMAPFLLQKTVLGMKSN